MLSSPIYFGNSINMEYNYDAWFKTFLEYSNGKEVSAEKISELILNSDMYDNFSKLSEINVLDIGCGNGYLSGMVVDNLHFIFPDKKIKYDAIDNNSALLKDFYKNCTTKSDNINTTVYKRDFFKNGFEKKNYDLVIASHCLYYTDDLEDSIEKAYSKLSKNGKLIIIHDNGKNRIFPKIRSEHSYADNDHFEQEALTEDIISQTLEKKDFQFIHTYQNYEMKLPCTINEFRQFYKTNPNKDFKNLISFIFEKPYNSLYKDKKIDEVLDSMEKYAENGNRFVLSDNLYIINKQ